MKKRKALFFDIDGTILSEETNSIPESAVRAIKEARKQGHLTFINTGRVRVCVPSRIKELGFDGILCGCGTELIYHGKSMAHTSLPEEFCQEIVQVVKKANVAAGFEGEKLYFEVPSRPEFATFASEAGKVFEKEIPQIFEWEGNIVFDKFVIWTDEKSNTDLIFDLVKDQMDIIVRSKTFFEIVPKGYSKAKAIQSIQELFDIALEDTYVFGDSSNDLSMFEYSPNAIAMKKHDPILDPYTSYVTDTVENDGIEKAMKALGLI